MDTEPGETAGITPDTLSTPSATFPFTLAAVSAAGPHADAGAVHDPLVLADAASQTVAAPAESPNARWLTRVLNGLGGQLTLRMANLDVSRSDVAVKSGVPAELLRDLQVGEAESLTLRQLVDIAEALGAGLTAFGFVFPPASKG
jgi:hypothetical protein